MEKATIFPATGMPDKSWWRALWPDPESVIRSMLIQPGMIVTDLGCGDGYFTASIARQVGQGRVIAVDLDPVMLDQAKVACASLKNCDWLLGNAVELHLLLYVLPSTAITPCKPWAKRSMKRTKQA
ncbi:MAG: hypothetical protein B7Z71_06945 [Acidocella sp. 21-58-7]|nr:MAG: hypothetical protein B7Z71_06945 [Acidocella sp. 21-58-7]